MRAEFIGQDRILILGISKALRSSGDTVREEMEADKFDIILLSITDEEIAGLREFMVHPIEVEMDDLEIIYEYYMKNFGETSIPPEAYITAIKSADQKGIEVQGIDIPSGRYEDMFVESVKLSDMLFLSLKKRRLMKRRWDVSDPELFSIQWDTYLNKGGYMKLELERARYISSEITSKKRSNTLVIVEVERFKDLVRNLSTLLPGYRLLQNGEETTAVWSERLS